HAALIALDQFIDEARLRNRYQHENYRDDGDCGEVEGIGSNDAGLVEAVDNSDDVDESSVFLQTDEIIEERRHNPAHRLRHDHITKRLEIGQAERSGSSDLAPMN